MSLSAASVSRSQTNASLPRDGVITLSGYGINVRVDRGHLLYEDGIGSERRRGRLARVGHGLKRLVVIGSDGMISLAALRWLADQNASFSMLDRDGSVLAATGTVRASDVKLRRAQAVALQNGTAFRISRELIDRKLAGQESVAKNSLCDEATALKIRQFRSELAEIESIDAVRLIESHAAKAYWTAWRAVTITFPRKDLPRAPEHWLTFGSRVSSLTGSPRLATNPANAILNYLYALLEAEARLAASTLGLDPGIGVLHVDAPYRDSLACDLMEAIRPEVDAFVLDWLKREPLSRNFFFEERNGNCRLMGPFASNLAQTAPTWARLVAPVAEWFAQEIHNSRNTCQNNLPARLTQRYRRVAQGGSPIPKAKPATRPARVCRGCGKEIERPYAHCNECMKGINAEQIKEVALLGRVAKLGPDAQAKRGATQSIRRQAEIDWNPSNQPTWLTSEFYSTKIQPRLTSMSCTLIAKRLNVSYSYADHIRKARVPHPRHWLALAELTGLKRS
ncbi:CRISPR-associated endonuclease Cas1 [Edaphobacter bradus]|uniref:CRISPR-associated endonuclease Cas1 n=1 Tax=Edaphobacter bradus TaxID=2259016 RepID=UPI0021E0681D|nr:CRISPR-associated endonuclease Cas1 [Edaphobacter bradus]